MKLYSIKKVAQILGVDVLVVKNFIINSGYWYFNKKQNRYMPYTKYCKVFGNVQKRFKMFGSLYVKPGYIVYGFTDIGLELLGDKIKQLSYEYEHETESDEDSF